MRRRPLAVIALLSAAAVAGAAAGADAATSIKVTAGKPSELEFSLSKRTAAAGKVTFSVTNKGSLKHDFSIAGRKSKLLGKNATQKVAVTLKAGRYQYVCTVPGHADGGMKGTLIVR